jgi:hypothetical protein
MEENMEKHEQVVIWWLNQSDHEMVSLLCEDAEIPQYIIKEFNSRVGRAGRGRLWIPEEIKFAGIKWQDDDPIFDAVGDSYGGIVIHRCDVHHIVSWPGFVTDENLRLIKISTIV